MVLHALHIGRGIAVIASVAMLIGSAPSVLRAQLSGQGATIGGFGNAEPRATIAVEEGRVTLHGAADTDATADSAMRDLALGMLLLLLGFLLHGLIVTRGERTVHVTAQPSRVRSWQRHGKRRETWYWVELQI